MIRFIISLFWPAKKRCDVTHLIWKAKKQSPKKFKKHKKQQQKEHSEGAF